MELKIYNPQEEGFLKEIDWNYEELKIEIQGKANDYMNLVYTADQVKDAKKDRANLNKFVEALESKRKEIKKQITEPYSAFEKQEKELVGIVNKAIANIDTQINFATNKLRLPQSGSFYFINNSRNATSPMFDQVHISKRMGKGFISDFGIAFFHTLHRLSHWQLSWRSNF